jgi:hypothetical protein
MLAGKCGCFARKVASDMQVQAKTWASHLIVIPGHIGSVLPRKVERVATHRLPGNRHNPPGNDPHINTFKNA